MFNLFKKKAKNSNTEMHDIVQKVSSNINSLSNECSVDAVNKEAFARKCGLNSVTDSGSFSALVAEHPDLPNVIVKVVPLYDKYLNFAEDCMAGKLKSKMWPTFHNITKLDTHAVILVERIEYGVRSYETNPHPDEYIRKVACKIMKRADNLAWEINYDELEDHQLAGYEQDLKDFIKDMVYLCKQHDAKSDMHGGNFMIRLDGSIVCIDPIFSNDRGDLTRCNTSLNSML